MAVVGAGSWVAIVVALWHDRCVPLTPSSDSDDRARGRESRRARRRAAGSAAPEFGYSEEPRRSPTRGRRDEPGGRRDEPVSRFVDAPTDLIPAIEPPAIESPTGGTPGRRRRRAAPDDEPPPRHAGAESRHAGAEDEPAASPRSAAAGPRSADPGRPPERDFLVDGHAVALAGFDPDPVDEAPVEPMVPVRRLLSLTVAGFSGLLTVGLVFGAYTARVPYAVVILGVQALFVLAWTVASRPPAPRVVAAVGLGAAVAADVAVVVSDPATLTPLAYVTAAGFVAGVVGQLLRPAGRVRVTESLGSTLAVVFGVVGLATLAVLTRQPGGRLAIVACLIAAGVAVAVARATDVILPYPRMSAEVARGGLGIVVGSVAGAVAASVAGVVIEPLDPQRTAVAGVVVAVVAAVIDLSVVYADASRVLAGEAPALWLARHMQGPLVAFALAAPAAYAASTLLLVQSG